MRKNRTGQSFSFDAIAATVLFIVLLIAALIYILQTDRASIRPDLTRESQIISQRLLIPGSADSLNISQGQIDDAIYQSLHSRASTLTGYQELRAQFGSRGDFCVHLEDAEGNIIYLDSGEVSAFGSGRAQIILVADPLNPIPC